MNVDRRNYLILLSVFIVQFLSAAFLYLSKASIPVFVSDLPVWEYDAHFLLSCISGDLDRCHLISRFPFGYTLNSAVLEFFTHSGRNYFAVVFLNLVFYFLQFLFFMFFIRSQYLVRPLLYCIVVFFSPILPVYLYSGNLEVQSGIMLGLFFTAMALVSEEKSGPRRIFLNAMIYVTAMMSVFYKDTAGIFLFILLFMFSIGRLLSNHYAPKLVLVFSIGLNWPNMLGLATGQMIACYMNVLKYGEIFPVQYLRIAKESYVEFYQSIIFLFFSIFSPNGGVLIFWSLAFVILIFAVIKIGYRFNYSALIFPTAFAVLQLLTLAHWWSPFGWNGWGNRLMIPPMLALIIVSIATLQTGRERPAAAEIGLNRILGRRMGYARYFLVPIFAFMILCSAYYVSISYIYEVGDLLHDSLVRRWEICERASAAILYDEKIGYGGMRSSEYYECAWKRLTYFPRPFENLD